MADPTRPLALAASGYAGTRWVCWGWPVADAIRTDGRAVGCSAHGDVVLLVERRSRHGTFYGCPHYPKCRTTVDLRRGKFGGPAVVYLPPGVWASCGSAEHWAWWKQEQQRRKEWAEGRRRCEQLGEYFDRESPYDEALDDANPELARGLNMVMEFPNGYAMFAAFFGAEVINDYPETSNG